MTPAAPAPASPAATTPTHLLIDYYRALSKSLTSRGLSAGQVYELRETRKDVLSELARTGRRSLAYQLHAEWWWTRRATELRANPHRGPAYGFDLASAEEMAAAQTEAVDNARAAADPGMAPTP